VRLVFGKDDSLIDKGGVESEMRPHTDLFTNPSDDVGPLPLNGFEYRPDFLTLSEEAALIQHLSAINFGELRMHGVVAKRRVGISDGSMGTIHGVSFPVPQSLIFYSRGENVPLC